MDENRRSRGSQKQAQRTCSLAAAGETVVINDRNRIVAEIVAPRRPGHESFIERGVREGWLTPAKRPFKPLPPRKPVPGLTLEQLLADREDRW
jgi:antitoxin (DNA-binding transcriptional repressor) of toxin-antitoxin stability system